MSKSPSLRRIQADIRELALDPSDQYYAAPMEHDMFVWHFTIRGAEGTDFEGGIYHGRILLPPEYPYKPPHIMFLTPSGRFETNTKVCLSFSAFHPELWQPAWGIRLILEALISFLPTPGDGAIGALDYKPEERRRLAKKSQSFVCPVVGPIAKLLPKLDPDRKNSAKGGGSSSVFAKEIAELKRLQQKREGRNKKSKNATKSKKTEETTTMAKTADTGEEAEPKTEARTAESTEEVPELLSPDTDNDKKAASSMIEKMTDGATSSASSDSDATAADADENTGGIAADTAAVSAEVLGNSAVAADNTGEESDANNVVHGLSKLYDLLLNISILLMLCICALLWKKGMDLKQELEELQEIPVGIYKAAASATSSAAASAAASEEL